MHSATNRTNEAVVSLCINVAVPRGPNDACEEAPPNAAVTGAAHGPLGTVANNVLVFPHFRGTPPSGRHPQHLGVPWYHYTANRTPNSDSSEGR